MFKDTISSDLWLQSELDFFRNFRKDTKNLEDD